MDAVILDAEIAPLLELAPGCSCRSTRCPPCATCATRSSRSSCPTRSSAPITWSATTRTSSCASTGRRASTGPLPCIYSIHGGGYVLGTYEMDDARFDRCCTRFRVRRGLGRVPARAGDALPGPARGLLRRAAVDLRPRRRARHRPRPRSASPASAPAAASPPALALLARDRGEVPLAFQLLECPMIDDRQTTSSSRLDGLPIWSRESNEFGWRSYLGDLYGTDDIPTYAAAARADDLVGPPTGARDRRRCRRLPRRGHRLRAAAQPVRVCRPSCTCSPVRRTACRCSWNRPSPGAGARSSTSGWGCSSAAESDQRGLTPSSMNANNRSAAPGSVLSSAASRIACTMRTRSSMSTPSRTAPAACARASNAAPEWRIASHTLGSPSSASSIANMASAASRDTSAACRAARATNCASASPGASDASSSSAWRLQLLDTVVEDGFHQRLARREVPVERADADAGGAGDLVHRRVGARAANTTRAVSTISARLRTASARRLARAGLVELGGAHVHGTPPSHSSDGMLPDSTCKRSVPPFIIRRQHPSLSSVIPSVCRPHPPRSVPQEPP